MNRITKDVRQLVEQTNTTSPYEICEQKGIIVTEDNLPINIKGFYTNILEQPYIFINKTLDEVEKRTVLAHELGHYILHTTQNSVYLKEHTMFSMDKFEKEADRFAMELLMYNSECCVVEGESVDQQQLAYEFGVPLWVVQLKYGE